jgi:hypothetical protein
VPQEVCDIRRHFVPDDAADEQDEDLANAELAAAGAAAGDWGE